MDSCNPEHSIYCGGAVECAYGSFISFYQRRKICPRTSEQSWILGDGNRTGDDPDLLYPSSGDDPAESQAGDPYDPAGGGGLDSISAVFSGDFV